jgi:AraC-like DNA-binding protein
VSRYIEIAPPPALRRFLDCLWVHEIDEPPPPEGRRLMPSGHVDFVWIAGLGVRVSGPHSRYSEPPGLERMLAVGARFHPGAAPQLLRTPASAMAEIHVALDAIDPRLAARVDGRLADAPDPAAAMAAFGSELARELRFADAPDPAVREAVRLLDGSATVAETAARTFVSERALQRRFSDHVGYGPKTLQRVLRFQRFLGALAAPRVTLASAAAVAGYADQAHLSREVRRLSGLTPGRLVSWQH